MPSSIFTKFNMAPFAISDLLGNVVGPPMKVHSWWLYHGWHENINDIYQRYIYFHDIFKQKYHILIFLIFLYFQNINLYYYYYLLTFQIHAYLTQTAQVPKLLDGAKISPTILTLSVECNNVTDDRHRRTAHAIMQT